MPKNPPKYLEHRFARISMGGRGRGWGRGRVWVWGLGRGGGGRGGGVRRAEMELRLELSSPPSMGQAFCMIKFNVSEEVV